MNFRSCRYFLAVCEAGSISAAAKKLYISQQSLSQHIRRMETELDAQLFHRDNPLTLTEAGMCVERAARRLLGTLEDMDRELAAIRGRQPNELVLGMLDYGTPDFVPPLADAFLKSETNLLIRTVDILPRERIPDRVQLVFSARPLDGEFQSELLFSDLLGVCVADDLLMRVYGDEWEDRKRRLEAGDITALRECPFVRMPPDTPLCGHSERIFAAAGFTPVYLPILGDGAAVLRFCYEGQAAGVCFLNHAADVRGLPPRYPLALFPEPVPAGYISFRADAALPAAAQRFLALSRRFLRGYGVGGGN